jgi:hypothetical protein
MTIFVPQTGNTALNLVLEQLANNVSTTISAGASNAVVVTDNAVVTPGGVVIGYVNRWIYVVFSDDQYGSGAATLPTNKSFWGLLNTNAIQQPTNFTNFTYTQISGGFGTVSRLYYKTTGARNIQWQVATAVPGADWREVPNVLNSYVAIDLDNITAATGNVGGNGTSVFSSVIYQANTVQPATPTGGTYLFTH